MRDQRTPWLFEDNPPQMDHLHKAYEEILKTFKKNLRAFYQEAPHMKDKGKVMAEMYVKSILDDMAKAPEDMRPDFDKLLDEVSAHFKDKPPIN